MMPCWSSSLPMVLYRRQAIEKLKGALDEVVIDGIETNLESQYEILENPVYQAGEADTGFMETQFGERER